MTNLKNSFHTAVGIVLFSLWASPLSADEIVVKANQDGSYLITAEIEDLGQFAGKAVKTASDFGVTFGKIFGANTKVDFSSGHVVDGPLTVSIARKDGTVGLYNVPGKIVAYDAQNSFTETKANYSLEGVVIFLAKDGKTLLADSGTVSLIKKQ